MEHSRAIIATVGISLVGLGIGARAEGATIAAEYAEGHRDVIVNGYGTPGLGTFRLADGDAQLVALCIEADVRHSNEPDAYAPAANQIASPELDVLLWWVDRHTPLDADTATAAAALAWYYAAAQRRGGGPVWADSAAGWAPITPLDPHPWDGPLPSFGAPYPIGLRAGGIDLETAEAKVAQLHRGVQALRGEWRLVADGQAFLLTAGGRPLGGQPVVIEIQPGHGPATSATIRTDGSGRAVPDLPATDGRLVVRARADAPGTHREWDGPDMQRLATPGVTWLTAELTVAPPPTTIPATTVPDTTMPDTTTPDTTTPDTTTPDTSTTSTSSTTTPATTAPATTAPATTAPATTAPATTAPATTAPATTAPATTGLAATSEPATTSSTMSVAPTTTSVPVMQIAPPPPPPPEQTGDQPPPTLPATGSADALATVLRLGDYAFAGGVLLLAAAGLTRRPDAQRPAP